MQNTQKQMFPVYGGKSVTTGSGHLKVADDT
jgi:hypothetical protein